MKFKKILLVYKESAYRRFFLKFGKSKRQYRDSFVKKELEHFKLSHQEHYSSLAIIREILRAYKVKCAIKDRTRRVDYSRYDLIITIGGDGTFLEAARNASNQVMLGINSSTNYSIGRYCIANVKNFEKILKKLIKNDYKIQKFNRLRIKAAKTKKSIDVLNDILISHNNPAMLCRYNLKIGKQQETQKSSGLWISTAAGSTGGIHSAGGKKLPQNSKSMQYRPRELFSGKNTKYKLKGSVLTPSTSITVTSLMQRGAFFCDGAHHRFDFKYGDKIIISASPKPIKTIKL